MMLIKIIEGNVTKQKYNTNKIYLNILKFVLLLTTITTTLDQQVNNTVKEALFKYNKIPSTVITYIHSLTPLVI